MSSAFFASFVIQAASGTTIEGYGSGPLAGGCGRNVANHFSPTSGGLPTGTYVVTITTAVVTVTYPAVRTILSKSASPTSGAPPLGVEFTYRLALSADETLFHVSVTDEGCSPVTYRSGDVNANALLEGGETWTFACSRTYGTLGLYTEAATARATSARTGLAVTSNSSQTTISVQGSAPFLDLRESASATSGPAPLSVEFTYTLASNGADTLANVNFTSAPCPPVYRSGDTNGDGLLQSGETWTFTCSARYSVSGTYSHQAALSGTSTKTGGIWSASAFQTTVTVTGGATRMVLSKSASPTSGPAPLGVEFTTRWPAPGATRCSTWR